MWYTRTSKDSFYLLWKNILVDVSAVNMLTYICVHVHMHVLAPSISLYIVSLRHLFLPSNPHPALHFSPLVSGSSNLFLSQRCWD